MDKLYNISILDDIDDQLEAGDRMVDPFNKLDVRHIHINAKAAQELFFVIDADKLIEATSDFDESLFDKFDIYQVSILQGRIFDIDEKMREYYARFSWWVCNQYLYVQQYCHKIDISDISMCNHKNVEIYLYSKGTANILEIHLSETLGIYIKHLNDLDSNGDTFIRLFTPLVVQQLLYDMQ